jgi:hypothetical protein
MLVTSAIRWTFVTTPSTAKNYVIIPSSESAVSPKAYWSVTLLLFDLVDPNFASDPPLWGVTLPARSSSLAPQGSIAGLKKKPINQAAQCVVARYGVT